MTREFLTNLGLEKEVIDKILDQNGTEISQLNARINAKDTEIGTLRSDLTKANTDLANEKQKVADLSKDDIEDIKRQLQNEKDARAADRKTYKILSFLQKEGCNDTDYLMFKEGKTIELDDKGEIKDAENLSKTLKEKYKNHFGTQGAEDKEKNPQTGGAGNFRHDRNGTPDDENPYTTAGWNLTKQWELEVNDPKKARDLQEAAKAAKKIKFINTQGDI